MNLFNVENARADKEVVEELVNSSAITIERIISTGQASPAEFWYNQVRDEWVALLQGKAIIAWKDGRIKAMKAGDWLFIPAGEEHRIAETSAHPPCIWLAVHGKMQ